MSRFINTTKGTPAEAGYVSGGIYITSITPTSTGNISNTTDPNAIGNTILTDITTDTDLIDITIEFEGASDAYTGSVKIGNTIIPNSFYTRIFNTRRYTLTYSYDITSISNGSTLSFTHSSGRTNSIIINRAPAAPFITNISIGSLPGIQTELKQGDTIDVTITTDTPISSLIINSSLAINATTISGLSGTVNTITLPISYTGTTLSNIPITLSPVNSFGSQGSSSTSSQTLPVNNLGPSFLLNSITYPAGQSAIKSGESADVALSVSNFDTILYSSPTSEISIPSTGAYTPVKTVSYLTGSYNITNSNMHVSANRTANDFTRTFDHVVSIANAVSLFSTVQPYTRLRSGGSLGTNAQVYTITINSDQALISNPLVTAPVGIISSITKISDTQYSFTITVDDTMTKGTFNFSVSTTNLANVSSIATDSYTLGGFISRDVYFSAFSDLSSLGVPVTDVTKLSAIDKDLIAMTFVSNNGPDATRTYTINDVNRAYDPIGSYLRWLDLSLGVNINTTGNAFIRIEETV